MAFGQYWNKTEYKGFTISLTQDDDAPNPRKEFDQTGKMICWHNRYELGDDHTWEVSDFKDFLQEQENNIIALPVYLYDHNGVTISTEPFSCPWDSGQIGWIYMEKTTIDQEFNGNKEQALKALQSQVEEYDTYLRNDVWCYKIEETEDSLCGLFGYEYCLQVAKEAIDVHLTSAV